MPTVVVNHLLAPVTAASGGVAEEVHGMSTTHWPQPTITDTLRVYTAPSPAAVRTHGEQRHSWPSMSYSSERSRGATAPMPRKSSARRAAGFGSSWPRSLPSTKRGSSSQRLPSAVLPFPMGSMMALARASTIAADFSSSARMSTANPSPTEVTVAETPGSARGHASAWASAGPTAAMCAKWQSRSRCNHSAVRPGCASTTTRAPTKRVVVNLPDVVLTWAGPQAPSSDPMRSGPSNPLGGRDAHTHASLRCA